MAGFRVEGNTSGNVAEVNASNQLKVTMETNAANTTNVGAVRIFNENDPGTATGTAYLKSGEISQDFRQRVGVDTIIFTDTFNATSQNTSNWKHAFSVMTMTQSAGFLNVNAAGTSTTSGQYCYLQTCRYFPLIGTAPLAAEFTVQADRSPTANEIIQFGFGVPTGAADCVDGVWFEYTSAGLMGVIRYNSGVAQKTAALMDTATFGTNTTRKCVALIGEREIEWWIDDVLYAEQLVPAAQGQPFLSTALPAFIQKYNSALVGSSPNVIFKVGDITISLMDIATNQTWANQMSSMGMGLQGTNGGTMGTASLIQWANATLPTAGAGSNTTAALGTFLGGIFQMTAPAGGTTDLIVSSYQNPVGGVNQTPRTIKLRGIKVSFVNAGATVTTTPATFAVAIGWGATVVSAAATESASFATATQKARRIQPLGVVSVPIGAVAGTPSNECIMDFESPVIINPGEFCQILARPLAGTATASQICQWIISPNLYQE